MSLRTAFLASWIASLAVFAFVMCLHLPLAVPAVPDGIADHQAAGDAATVDAIHAAWRDAGVYGQARTAMIGDLSWIWLYGLGSVLGGMYFYRSGKGIVRFIGIVAILSGLVFLATDYTETICQFVQLQSGAGDDSLAATAAAARPVKTVAFIVAFIAIIAGFAVQARKRSSRLP